LREKHLLKALLLFRIQFHPKTCCIEEDLFSEVENGFQIILFKLRGMESSFS